MPKSFAFILFRHYKCPTEGLHPHRRAKATMLGSCARIFHPLGISKSGSRDKVVSNEVEIPL